MSPFVTVGVLTVLWLIVVVPMIVRRSDEAARDRSISQFGRSMRALGRRSDTRREPLRPAPDPEVFVAGSGGSTAVAVRRSMPAAQEVPMHPSDRNEISAARAAMMARRRRSLAILGIGSLITTVFALVGGGILWLLAGLFLFGLAGYLFFLRAQALRERAHRQGGRSYSDDRVERGYDAGAETEEYAELDDTVVRIDDDDIHLQTMDTIDLTGLYPVEGEAASTSGGAAAVTAVPAAERRAS